VRNTFGINRLWVLSIVIVLNVRAKIISLQECFGLAFKTGLYSFAKVRLITMYYSSSVITQVEERNLKSVVSILSHFSVQMTLFIYS